MGDRMNAVLARSAPIVVALIVSGRCCGQLLRMQFPLNMQFVSQR